MIQLLSFIHSFFICFTLSTNEVILFPCLQLFIGHHYLPKLGTFLKALIIIKFKSRHFYPSWVGNRWKPIFHLLWEVDICQHHIQNLILINFQIWMTASCGIQSPVCQSSLSPLCAWRLLFLEVIEILHLAYQKVIKALLAGQYRYFTIWPF